MSSSVVRKELEAFLSSNEPGVFVVKGMWGVGKTHLVRQTVESGHRKWGSRKYALVSLFGVNSLAELRESIFVELVSDAPGAKHGKELLKHLSEIAAKTGEAIGGLGSGVGNFASRWWMNKAIPESIVVIDDMERRGDGLNLRDLLGFLSQLKEQHKCQVVLIFNEGELDKDSLNEIGRYREKVFDREVAFLPVADEIIRLGFPDAPAFVVEILTRLNVDNIRAVQKVKQFLARLPRHIDSIHEGAKEEVTGSAVILGWFYFRQEDNGALWKYLQTYDWVTFSLLRSRGTNEKTLTEEEKQHRKYALRLTELGYRQTGPIEKILIEALETGLSEMEGIDEHLAELSKQIEMSEAQHFLTNQVWRIYHGSFDDDLQQFVEAMTQCFATKSRNLSVHSLEEAVDIMEKLEREDVADELVYMYFEARPDLQPKERLQELSLTRRQNSRVAARLREEGEQERTEVSSLEVKRIIHGMILNNGWDPDDIGLLGQYSETAWHDFFKNELREERHNTSYIKRILDFRTFEDGRYKQVGIKAEAAMKKIAEESQINKVRASGYGVSIDDLA